MSKQLSNEETAEALFASMEKYNVSTLHMSYDHIVSLSPFRSAKHEKPVNRIIGRLNVIVGRILLGSIVLNEDGPNTYNPRQADLLGLDAPHVVPPEIP